MDLKTKAELVKQAGGIVSSFFRAQLAKPKFQEEPADSETAPPAREPVAQKTTRIALPTAEETREELKRRLGRELYKAELDLAGGLRIAGKPCTCLEGKHTLEMEAAAEELIPEEPGNPVYREIIQWIRDNGDKVTPEAVDTGQYVGEYPKMAAQFRDFRKRVMGTVGFDSLKMADVMKKPENTTATSPGTLTLEEAKKLAAEEAAREVEKAWNKES